MSARSSRHGSRRLSMVMASLAAMLVPLAAILFGSTTAEAGPPNTGVVCSVEYLVWDVQLLLGPAAPPFCVE